MRNFLLPTLVSVVTTIALVTLMGSACTGQNPPGQLVTASQDAAKDFSGLGSDGKTHSLVSLTEGGRTLVLYFVKNGCGANPIAVPLFDKTSKSFLKSEKVNFVAVFNDDLETFKEFKKEYGVEFLGILDPNHEVIKAYGIKTSQGAVAIQDGKIVKSWKSYGQKSQTELGEFMAKANGSKFETDLSDAPKSESFG